MSEKFDSNEIVDLKALLISNSIQIDTIVQLLIEKDIFEKNEFLNMLERVQKLYNSDD